MISFNYIILIINIILFKYISIKWLLEKRLNIFMLEKINFKVSVLIANYNNEQYLEDCIKSILEQSYKNIA